MVEFSVGDVVVLSNTHTRYGLNGIVWEDWGCEATVVELDGKLDSEQCYFVRTASGATKHVVQSMLSLGAGPW